MQVTDSALIQPDLFSRDYEFVRLKRWYYRFIGNGNFTHTHNLRRAFYGGIFCRLIARSSSTTSLETNSRKKLSSQVFRSEKPRDALLSPIAFAYGNMRRHATRARARDIAAFSAACHNDRL